MDWGLGIALQGLYGRNNSIERNKQEMATMEAFANRKEHDAKLNEQAQLKEQAYMNEISKFSDDLLGPDRDKINQKAKVLQARFKEKLSYYGGDMKKFFADGGHKFMADYKSAIINSPEATTYKTNKQNMDRLLDVMSKGKGHLINANDYQSLVNYQKNGGGNITFTGMYNEIEMPDLDAYDYGQEIPAQDILDNNFVAIYGNYIIDNPQHAELDPMQLRPNLIAYTQSHYGGKGKNWRRQANAIKEKNRHEEAMAKLINENQKIKGGAKKKTVTDVNGNQVEIWEDTTPLDKDYTNLLSNNVLRGIHSVAPNAMKLDDFQKGYDGKDNPFFNKNFEKLNPVNVVSEHLDLSEKGFLDFGRTDATKNTSLGISFNDYFIPANAYTIKPFMAHKDKIGEVLFEGLEIKNGKIIGMTPTDDMFLPNGSSLSAHAAQETPLEVNEYTGDYAIKNIFIGGVTETKNGKEIVMYRTDNEGNVKEDAMKENQAKYEGDINGNNLIIQIEDDRGQVFYKALEYNDVLAQKINSTLGSDNQLANVDKDYSQKQKSYEYNQKLTTEEQESVAKSWEVVNENVGGIFKEKTSEAMMLSPQGTFDQESANFVKSYYVALASMVDGQLKNTETLSGLVETPGASIMNIVKEAKDEGYDVKQKFQQGYSGSEIITDLMNLEDEKDDKNPQNIQILEIWRQNMNYLSSLGQ